MKKAQKTFILSAIGTFIAFLTHLVVIIATRHEVQPEYAFRLRTNLRYAFTIRETGITGEQIIMYAIVAAALLYLLVWFFYAIRKERSLISVVGMLVFALTVFTGICVWVEKAVFTFNFRQSGPGFEGAFFTLIWLVFHLFLVYLLDSTDLQLMQEKQNFKKKRKNLLKLKKLQNQKN